MSPKGSKPGCPSGQREQTVNLPVYAFGGSNPSPGTGAEPSAQPRSTEYQVLSTEIERTPPVIDASYRARRRGRRESWKCLQSRAETDLASLYFVLCTQYSKNASLAQWQSTSMVRKGSRVQIPEGAPDESPGSSCYPLSAPLAAVVVSGCFRAEERLAA